MTDLTDLERLRLTGTTSERLHAENAELRAEVERLRAELNRVMSFHNAYVIKTEARLAKVAGILTEGLGTFNGPRLVHAVEAALAVAQPEDESQVDMTPQDSPDFYPKELKEFEARGYKRVNR